MAEQVGHKRHLWFKKETTWGTAVTCDIWLPFTSYSVKVEPSYYQGTGAFTGVRQRKAPVQVNKLLVRGSVSGDCYGYQVNSGSLKSILEHLWSAAVSAPADVLLDSLTFNLYDVNDQKVHAGCRINSMTITGSEDQPNLTYSAEIEGQSEDTVTVPTLVQTVPQGDAFLFKDVTFSIGGSAVTINSFSIGIQNNLIVKCNNSAEPTLIVAGDRNVSLNISIQKSANTYDAIMRAVTRSDLVGSLVLKGAHGGTGSNTYTTMTTAIDRMNLSGMAETFSRSDLDSQSLDFAIIKPNTTDNDIDTTWGTSA